MEDFDDTRYDDTRYDDRDETHLLDSHQDATKKEKSLSFIYCGIMMLVGALLILIIVLANKNNQLSNKLSKQEATESMNGIIIQVVNTGTLNGDLLYIDNQTEDNIYNLTYNQLNEVHLAFSTFDKNDDDLWSINEHYEYLLYFIETSGGRTNYSTFSVADIDDDNIVSFRELVYITTLLNASYKTTSTMTKKFIYDVLIPAAINDYGLQDIYSVDNGMIINSSNFNIFEYVSALLMDGYDINGNGYVTYENYLSISINKSFISRDLNGDNFISFDEYLNTSFSINGLSFFSSLTEASQGKNITLESFIISDIINLNVDKEAFLLSTLYQCPNMKLSNQSYGLNTYYNINNNVVNSINSSNSRRRMYDVCDWCYGAAYPGTETHENYCADCSFCNGFNYDHAVYWLCLQFTNDYSGCAGYIHDYRYYERVCD